MRHPGRCTRSVAPAAPVTLLLAAALAVPGSACGPEVSAGAQEGGGDEPPADSGVVLRRVWSGSGVDVLGDPSPDGRLLSYTDWSTGDLAIRNLEADESRRVTGKGSWQQSSEFAEYSVFSPDGERIAYSWYRDGYELRIIGVDGSDPRVVYRNEDVVSWLRPHAWEPDGRAVLVTLAMSDGSTQLARISAQDGTHRVLKASDWRSPLEAAFSPDGKSVAFDFPPESDSRTRDLYVMAADGSREIRLTDTPGDEMLLDWLPGDGGLLYATPREGGIDVWRLPMEGGRKSGEPELVRKDVWHAVPLGGARTGYFFGVAVSSPEVHTAVVAPARGEVLSPPQPLTRRAGRRVGWPAWSPDGARLGYVSQPIAPGRGKIALVIRTVATGETREFFPESNYFNELEWTPDGRSVLTTATVEGRSGIYRVDLHSGELEGITFSNPRGGVLRGPELSPAGDVLYFERRDKDPGAAGVVARKLETGEERLLHRGPVGGLALSPDGRELAVLLADGTQESGATNANLRRLVLLPVDGGEPRELLRLESPTRFAPHCLTWTPDGRHVLFGRLDAGEEEMSRKTRIFSIPASGGEPLELFGAEKVRRLGVHPDGRRLVFSAGSQAYETWVMEGLPGTGAGAPSGDADVAGGESGSR